jgi:hypothetical protein
MGLQDEIEKLKQDNKALKEEFATPDNSAENISKQLSALIPEAIYNLSHLITHGESESVRLAASKYVLDIARTSTTADDALSNLLRDISKSQTLA